MKKVTIVGGGPGGVFAALFIKDKHPEFDVSLIDKNVKLLKKFRMTGNGKCNIGPNKDNIEAYNHPNFVSNLFEKVSYEQYISLLRSLSILTKNLNNRGVYPVSESANNVADNLTLSLKQKDIKIIQGNMVDYLKSDGAYHVILDDGKHIVSDYLVFSTGGCSYPKTGSSIDNFDIYKKHGYKVESLIPSLTYLNTKEKIKDLFGERVHANLKLFEDGKEVYQENGEIIFKKDGINGICVMNASAFMKKDHRYKVSLDLTNYPDGKISKADFISLKGDALSIMKSIMPINLGRYILDKCNIGYDKKLKKEELEKLYEKIQNLTFEVSLSNDFENSQVTRGGISLKDLDDNLKSRLEDNVYFAGEMVDIDGLCGGYNLRFVITSAYIISEQID